MPGRFLSVVFGGHAARASNTPPGPSAGQGKKAARGRPVGSPLGAPQTYPKSGGMHKLGASLGRFNCIGVLGAVGAVDAAVHDGAELSDVKVVSGALVGVVDVAARATFGTGNGGATLTWSSSLPDSGDSNHTSSTHHPGTNLVECLKSLAIISVCASMGAPPPP